MDKDPGQQVIDQIQAIIQESCSRTDSNLAWLQQAMHPFFFSFNRAEPDALAVLVESLYRIHRLPYIRLADRPKHMLIAQNGVPNSIYNTLSSLPKRDNLSYSEINTSLLRLPNSDYFLEVLRFDYNAVSDAEVAAALAKDDQSPPVGIKEKIEDNLRIHAPNFDTSQTDQLVKLLWINNPDYVHVSHPERLARVLDLYQKTQAHGGIHLDIDPIDNAVNGETNRVLFGVSNPPQRDFLLQVFEVFKRLKIGVKRTYTITLSNGIFPTFLASFYVQPRHGAVLENGNELFQALQDELYNTQIISSDSTSFNALVATGIMSGMDATLIKALITFCHTNLAHNKPDQFDPEVVQRAFIAQPELSQQLVKLFHARFKPNLVNRESIYAELLQATKNKIDNFNTGRRFLDETRRVIFRCAMSFITHCLKTNFFVDEKHALAFRLDPAYLEELGEDFTADLPKERPFRITFFAGRSGSGYHIGFSDIARGGWRTLMTQGHDDYTNSANTLFRENYVLAHTQHLKNKDIYEGGSKMVSILNTRPGTPQATVLQYLYKLQYGFANAFLDLYVTENGKAKDPRVVDYYGEDEPIELGPDENMHDVMIELIAQLAVQRGYLLGAGIMSSKKVGINHKEYGVTSIGVIRFAEVTMQETLGINMHTDPFSIKITGGPNGDVAGNSMRLLLERCEQVQIRMIVDGTAAAFDPEGLDHDSLCKVILKADLDAFDANALHEGAFIIYRSQKKHDGMRDLYKQLKKTSLGLEEDWISTDEFNKIFNQLTFTVETDLFIPAGGRPETIAMHNVDQFFKEEGEPSARVIVEGANSFITPDARRVLQQRGVVIMRDASANKCGVISSSYEIIANLTLSEAEFLAHKQQYVNDVIAILNQMAEQEARVVIKRQREAGGKITYTDISTQVSQEINAHYARMFAYFQANPHLVHEAAYKQAMLAHMPALIQTEQFKERIERLPEKVKYAILASKLASSMVYFGDDNTVYGDIIEAQVKRLA
ncbi:NAD-glutamate dehydrogenase domain-containing protein [uncultured Thiothrix sp.]|uniref:NAD-glutamate dehydrogenase domain-containing protein n=1 Tax=uncultured Thiothrix sp. TaxID=223185 RepID=UPI002605E025|nr:NAD-glutamate dehydrogenase domain-containing protein [uncultured Thiothrix sp.]HMT92282.1 NAD-glutamate dehydrogenase [Thiolinea sp.]